MRKPEYSEEMSSFLPMVLFIAGFALCLFGGLLDVFIKTKIFNIIFYIFGGIITFISIIWFAVAAASEAANFDWIFEDEED
jgi:drug/metabolite transporter superfamily protein YnfA